MPQDKYQFGFFQLGCFYSGTQFEVVSDVLDVFVNGEWRLEVERPAGVIAAWLEEVAPPPGVDMKALQEERRDDLPNGIVEWDYGNGYQSFGQWEVDSTVAVAARMGMIPRKKP